MVEEMGFFPSAVLSLEEPRMLKAESFELEAMLGDCALKMWKYEYFGQEVRLISFSEEFSLPVTPPLRIAPPLMSRFLTSFNVNSRYFFRAFYENWIMLQIKKEYIQDTCY